MIDAYDPSRGKGHNSERFDAHNGRSCRREGHVIRRNAMQATTHRPPEGNGPPAELDRRYQRIGISAVAAAVQYQAASRNPAYAPATIVPRDDLDETRN
jgi:hypothetical protein